ncbi:PA14 domain-containing protein [Akkermansia sp. N21169]|jgi:hypothetical protein|uniref:PA14 domain-containing protein n=1 Tax=Akkermansia sp. N21169 TaxID=3040765 RepID=UPI00244ED11D|nr:PA14 domain-containing protein [Akkermansia sp. N21169]MDH3068295.1 PA14 domain-containing protein [Akkermansia sp. N21169]
MAISTKPFHPLDAENNRRYKVKKKDAPKIDWHKTEETGAHDWEGYIRIPEDGTYNFTIQIDDNGYLKINGEKVVELTGSNSSKKATGSKELKKGFHYAKLHHENLEVPEAIAPYPNAEEFVPQMDGKDLELWEIDAPKNLMKAEDAQKLLGYYNVVDFATMSQDQVWNHIGGWFNEQHLAGVGIYQDSCALRLSIAFCCKGISLSGVKDSSGKTAANNITLVTPPGNLSALNPGMTGQEDPSTLQKHVVFSAAAMSLFLHNTYGESDYADKDAKTGYCTPQEGDIVIFGQTGHVGMAPGNNMEKIGNYGGQPIWLLYRSTLDD